MLVYLILLFTLVPIVELAVLLRVGGIIGAGNTIAIVIITGVLGAYLARMQGLKTMYAIQNDMSRGRMPADKIFDGVLIFIGGILLLTPGLVTDAIGFMTLIPITRGLLKKYVKYMVRRTMQRTNVRVQESEYNDNIIDAEYREED